MQIDQKILKTLLMEAISECMPLIEAKLEEKLQKLNQTPAPETGTERLCELVVRAVRAANRPCTRREIMALAGLGSSKKKTIQVNWALKKCVTQLGTLRMIGTKGGARYVLPLAPEKRRVA